MKPVCGCRKSIDVSVLCKLNFIFLSMAVPVFWNQLGAYGIVVYFPEISLLHYMASKLFTY